MTTTLPASTALFAFQEAQSFARQALSPATLRAYRADWNHFTAWCATAELAALPAEAETVAAYLSTMARTHKRNTISRRLIAIGQAHKLAGYAWVPGHPAIRATLRGMYRAHGRAVEKATALGLDEVRRLLDACPPSIAGRRDRALFLLGFAGALRRSELAAVRREDVTFRAKGLRLFLPHSKGDQEGQGAEVGIPKGNHPETCPVTALAAWIDASGCTEGPVFRCVRADGTILDTPLHANSIGKILSRRALEAGLEPGPQERLSSHGFRAGFITDAYRAGARDEHIMGHSRHRDLKTMHGYIRRAKLLSESPASLLGL